LNSEKKQKLKILYISHEFDPYSNGEIKFIYNCALNFLRKGNEVHLLGYGAYKEILKEGALFHKIPRIIKRPILLKSIFFIFFTSIFLINKKKKFNIIHVSGPNTIFPHHINTCQFVHSAYKRYLKYIKFPLWRKLYYVLYYGIGSIIEKIVYSKSKKIIAVSQKIKRELIKYAKVKEKKIEVIYNGINPEEFPFKKNNEKQELIRENPFLKEKTVFLFAGDINSNRKGIENLIKAFKKIDEDAFLIILGNKKNSPYPEMVKKLNLENKIKFLGFKKNISFYYRACDFFIFPTFYEPFGLVIIETLSSGTPPLVSDKNFCGSAELIEDGKEGFIIKNPFDTEEIIITIKKALKNKKNISRLSINSLQKVKIVYFENIFKKYEKIYSTFI